MYPSRVHREIAQLTAAFEAKPEDEKRALLQRAAVDAVPSRVHAHMYDDLIANAWFLAADVSCEEHVSPPHKRARTTPALFTSTCLFQDSAQSARAFRVFALEQTGPTATEEQQKLTLFDVYVQLCACSDPGLLHSVTSSHRASVRLLARLQEQASEHSYATITHTMHGRRLLWDISTGNVDERALAPQHLAQILELTNADEGVRATGLCSWMYSCVLSAITANKAEFIRMLYLDLGRPFTHDNNMFFSSVAHVTVVMPWSGVFSLATYDTLDHALRECTPQLTDPKRMRMFRFFFQVLGATPLSASAAAAALHAQVRHVPEDEDNTQLHPERFRSAVAYMLVAMCVQAHCMRESSSDGTSMEMDTYDALFAAEKSVLRECTDALEREFAIAFNPCRVGAMLVAECVRMCVKYGV